MKTFKYSMAVLAGMLIIVGNASALTVTSPNGGETWIIGSTHTITWDYSGPDRQLKLELLKGGGMVGTIAWNIPAGQKTYQWTVGEYIGGRALSGTDYKIRVKVMYGTEADSSNGSFTIMGLLSQPLQEQKPPAKLEKKPSPSVKLGEKSSQPPPMEKELPVRVIFPNGGEKLEAGLEYTVKWEGTSVGRSGNVNVGLFRGSTQVAPLCTNVPNTGSCTGRIDPQIHYQSLRVRVWSASPILFPADESDGDVMIANYRNIKILSPNGGETWKLGDPWQIRWDTGGGWEGEIQLLLHQDSTGKNFLLSLTPLASDWYLHIPNTGAFTVIPPLSDNSIDRFIKHLTDFFHIPNGDFRVCIKVMSGGDPIPRDCSNNTFVVTW